MSLSKPMRQIDTGITSAVWATDANKGIYYLNGLTFHKVDGELIHVSAGESGVWGVNAANNIFYRDGTKADPKGTGTCTKLSSTFIYIFICGTKICCLSFV